MWKKKKILRRKTLENVIIFLAFRFELKKLQKNTILKIAIIVNIVYKHLIFNTLIYKYLLKKKLFFSSENLKKHYYYNKKLLKL